jgi:hypothetical protein
VDRASSRTATGSIARSEIPSITAAPLVYAPVLEGDRTLFDMEDHGIVHRGISTVSIDLGLTTQVNLVGSGSHIATLQSFIVVSEQSGTSLLSVVRFEAPDWLEYARRLAINDLQWMDLATPRNTRRISILGLKPFWRTQLKHKSAGTKCVTSRPRFITNEETAYIDLLLKDLDANSKKNGLQRLCAFYRNGSMLLNPAPMRTFITGLLYDESEKVQRWALNASRFSGPCGKLLQF